jgi:hypothetical protein
MMEPEYDDAPTAMTDLKKTKLLLALHLLSVVVASVGAVGAFIGWTFPGWLIALLWFNVALECAARAADCATAINRAHGA